MDIVYPFRAGPRDSLELRMSLRSLCNIPHDKVFVIGEKPGRIRNVIHIQAEDNLGSKYANVINKLNMICNDSRISDDFILMNDDMYIMNPIDSVPYYSKGTLKSHLRSVKQRVGKTSYWHVVEAVRKLYPDGYSFNVHCPIVYNKKLLKELLSKCEENISIRSLYCNMYNIEPIPFDVGKRKDCKVFKEKDISSVESSTYLSSDNAMVFDTHFISLLFRKFPKMCLYERRNHQMGYFAKEKINKIIKK